MKTYFMFYCMFSSYENDMSKVSKNRIKELWNEGSDRGFISTLKAFYLMKK